MSQMSMLLPIIKILIMEFQQMLMNKKKVLLCDLVQDLRLLTEENEVDEEFDDEFVVAL
jgi:hypothetical protein